MLTTLLLLKAGYAYVPYSSLEGVIENSKEGYYLALRQTQGTLRTAAPNWQPWLIIFLRALQQQERRLAAKVERERVRALAGTGRAFWPWNGCNIVRERGSRGSILVRSREAEVITLAREGPPCHLKTN